MELSTQDPHSQKEHTEIYKIVEFCCYWVDIEQDTATQDLENKLKNLWIPGTCTWPGVPMFLGKSGDFSSILD